ncbi:MAG: PIN domain-containing protein [Pseudomonadota bacterium]
MKAVLDACVIYPTVMRQMLLGVADRGVFAPLWSARILEEWRRAAMKLGPEAVVQAEIEASRMTAQWPEASVTLPDALSARLWLPDANDVHVLAAAVAGSADLIVTMNARDFPRHILAEEGVSRADPDTFLLGVFDARPELVQDAAQQVLNDARTLSGQDWTMRALMKKARLPRLGKALERRAAV